MAEGMGAVVKGVREVGVALTEMDVAVNEATRLTVRRATRYTKGRIKGSMRGRPRWGHKGADPVTGQPAVHTGRVPDHINRTGGPGRLTGDLSRSIRNSRRPRPEGAGAWSAVVMAGGNDGYQNRYKATVEAKTPYFKPGVEKSSPKIRAMFEGSWAAATNGKGKRR